MPIIKGPKLICDEMKFNEWLSAIMSKQTLVTFKYANKVYEWNSYV